MLGEEVNPADHLLAFSWNGPKGEILWVTRGKPYTNSMGVANCKKYVGHVAPNGWTGKSRAVIHPLGEPLWCNFKETLSMTEIKQIIAEWETKNPKS